MITTGFDKRVQVQQIIDNQLPEFLISESPKAVDFLKQYYISQEYQGGNIDITDNLDQYLRLGFLLLVLHQIGRAHEIGRAHV